MEASFLIFLFLRVNDTNLLRVNGRELTSEILSKTEQFLATTAGRNADRIVSRQYVVRLTYYFSCSVDYQAVVGDVCLERVELPRCLGGRAKLHYRRHNSYNCPE